MPEKVLVTREIPEAGLKPLEDFDVTVLSEAPPERDELLEGARGAEGVLSTVTEKIDGEFMDAAGEGLKVVANLAVGYDNVDVEAANERGVIVTNTPGVLDEATADVAFALILATSRRLIEADRFVRTGEPWIWGPLSFLGLDLSAGATLGVVGLGRIGLAVARRAHAFRMRIIATGGRTDSPQARELGVTAVDLDELLATSDVVSLHCPLTPATRHLIGAAELARMKDTAILVNTARGPVVDERALIDALHGGVIAGAGLDVYEHEPEIPPELRKLDNVVLLPHIASAGAATREAMALLAVDNVAAVLAGRPPLTPVGR